MNFYNNLFYLFTRRFLIIDKKIERKFGISVFFFSIQTNHKIS